MQLRHEGFTMAQTAEAIAREYNLERVPNTTTIFRWLNESTEALNEAFEKRAMAYRLEQDAQIDEMERQLWPIIVGGHGLRIQRWKQTAEGPEPFIDEHAYDEWLKAYDRFLKLMQRRARLWNLDLAKVELPTPDGPKSYQDLLLWINQTIVYPPEGEKQAKGKEIPEMPGLSFDSGIPELDADIV